MRKKKKKVIPICPTCPNRVVCPDPCNPSSCEYRTRQGELCLRIEYRLYEIGERIVKI